MINEQSALLRLPIHSVTDVVFARRQGLEKALGMGFPLPDATKIAVVISELGRNIVLYTDGGEITLTVHEHGQKGIEIVAKDEGPGIPDVEMVLSGGYTTSRGLGVGVSGLKKIMDEFEIDSVVGQGTTIRALKRLR